MVSAGSSDQAATVLDLANPVLEKARREQLEQIVLDKLKFYAKQYPDIDFVILDSAGDVARNMQVLAQVIGQAPTPLDYEHSDDLRETLLVATLVRIEFLLSTDSGSATFFKPGKGAVAQRKYVCVVTIHPWAIAKDNRAATRHLLELPEVDFDAISPVDYLDQASHLHFALDHEIYHCLDTLYNGPQELSQREYWAGYHMRKDEAGADAFGTIMNIASHGTVTPYAQMLKNIRGLTLLGDDPNHYTYPAIAAALQMEPLKLAQNDVRERFRLATAIRDRVIGSYDDYVRYINAAYYATMRLGRQPDVILQQQEKVDNKAVQALIMETRNTYRSLTGRELQINE